MAPRREVERRHDRVRELVLVHPHRTTAERSAHDRNLDRVVELAPALALPEADVRGGLAPHDDRVRVRPLRFREPGVRRVERHRIPDPRVHPAAASLSSLAVDVSAAAKDHRPRGKKKDKVKDKDKAEETVVLTVTLPKQTRRQLRRKAETYGGTAEEAAAPVLRVWAGG